MTGTLGMGRGMDANRSSTSITYPKPPEPRITSLMNSGDDNLLTLVNRNGRKNSIAMAVKNKTYP